MVFRFPKSLDIITVFQKAGSPASVRVGNLAKQISAKASATSTIDQASDAPHGISRDEFQLEVTETLPTEGQVETVLEYVGRNKVKSIINGAANEKDALRRFKENKESLILPLVVDWTNGKAVAGDNESEILKLLNAQK